MKRRLYFAYGSNLDQTQMIQRCPDARLVGPAILRSHRLAFGGHSRMWGGAVATVKRSKDSSVEGLLYLLTEKDSARLDGYEGCPRSYRRVRRRVYDDDGRERRPFLYTQNSSKECSPSERYFMVLLEAYNSLGFDRRELFRAAGVE